MAGHGSMPGTILVVRLPSSVKVLVPWLLGCIRASRAMVGVLAGGVTRVRGFLLRDEGQLAQLAQLPSFQAFTLEVPS